MCVPIYSYTYHTYLCMPTYPSMHHMHTSTSTFPNMHLHTYTRTPTYLDIHHTCYVYPYTLTHITHTVSTPTPPHTRLTHVHPYCPQHVPHICTHTHTPNTHCSHMHTLHPPIWVPHTLLRVHINTQILVRWLWVLEMVSLLRETWHHPLPLL